MGLYPARRKNPPVAITAFESEAADAARRERDRARDEVRLLACIAPIGRRGIALAVAAGLSIDHFAEDDTRAIFAALLAAEQLGCIGDKEHTCRLVRTSLAMASLWDPDDLRSYVISSLRWGPGPLSVLFTRVSRRDAERSVQSLARELIAADARKRVPA